MNGRDLTLGLVGALAVGAALGRRGSRSTAPFVSQHGPYTITVMFQPAAPGKRNASGRAKATLNGSEIGEVVFEDNGDDRLYVQWSSVDKDHRRQGLANAMYDAIERATGLPLTSGDIASSLGALGLWIKRGKLTREQALERYGEWVSRDEEFSEGSEGYEEMMDTARRVLRGSRAVARPPAAFRDLAAWTAWARTEGVELRLAKTPSYTVEITDLFADTTGTGAGTRVMEALVKAADKAGMPLVLHPSSPRNVEFYGRFGFSLFGSYGMMRRETKGRGSRAATTAPVVLYHGAQRWEGAPEIVAHRKGHAEHGPGIYLTTSYETAARYAKGGGSVYRMELRPGVRWLQDAKLDKGPVLRWLKGVARLRGKEKLVAGVERVTARTGDTFPAEILVNQFVNEGASSGQHGPALAAFLVENGVDASLTSPPMFGGTGGAHGEDWVIVFNPDILRSVTKVTAREVGKQAPFDLPRVTR